MTELSEFIQVSGFGDKLEDGKYWVATSCGYGMLCIKANGIWYDLPREEVLRIRREAGLPADPLWA